MKNNYCIYKYFNITTDGFPCDVSNYEFHQRSESTASKKYSDRENELLNIITWKSC